MSLLGEPAVLLRAGLQGPGVGPDGGPAGSLASGPAAGPGAGALPGRREQAWLAAVTGASAERFQAAFCRALLGVLRPGPAAEAGRAAREFLALYRWLRAAIALRGLDRAVVVASGAYLLRLSRAPGGRALGPLGGLHPVWLAAAALATVAKAYGVNLGLGELVALAAGAASPAPPSALDLELYLLQASGFSALADGPEYWDFCCLVAREMGEGGDPAGERAPGTKAEALLHHALYLSEGACDLEGL